MIIQIPRRSFPLRPALPLICPIEPQTQTQPNKHLQKRSKVQILPSDVTIKYITENYESCYIPLYDSLRNLGYESFLAWMEVEVGHFSFLAPSTMNKKR
jgi:hypothetical protein